MPAEEHIRLAVPASPDYGRVARAAASSLALRVGVAYRRVDDLRLAIDESVILLLGGADRDEAASHEGELAVDFTVRDDALVIDLTTRLGSPTTLPTDGIERLRAIASDIIDDLVIDDPPGHIRITVAR